VDLITPREPALPPCSDGARRERSIVAEHAVFAVRSSELEIAVATDCSRRRAVNEDAHSPLDGPSAIYVVADGVGGGAMAAWASRELVRRLHDVLDRRDVNAAAIGAALLDADLELRRDIARETASAGAATVALCASNGPSLAHWFVAWVGDCRVYRTRATASGAAELLTRDDTYEHLGERPPPGGSPHDPARMVGNGAVVTPNVESVHLRDGEMLVLCSDGLHKNVDAREIGRVLQSQAPPSRGCERLLEIARLRSSDDDATVLVVHRKARDGFSWMAQR